MPGSLIELDQSTFEEMIRDEKKFVVVEFFTDTCNTCHALEMVCAELEGKYKNDAVFVKINAGTNPGLAIQFNVLGVPAFKFFKNGKLVGDLVGSIDTKKLEDSVINLIRSKG